MSEPPSKLVESFSSRPLADHRNTWDALYAESFHPWDRAGPSLALSDLLAQRSDLIPSPASSFFTSSSARRRPAALVPGCGLGHDVLLLAARGYDVWGVDGSEKAIEGARKREEEARKREEKGELEEVLQVQGEMGTERGTVHWLVADYFKEGWEKGLGAEGSGAFDLIFDYTFLCALPPSARPLWSLRTAFLLAHLPTSRLICLEFPIGKPLSEQGPPWGLWPETYEALLSNPGEEIEYEEDRSGRPKDAAAMRPKDGALHRLCLVKPKRTHQAGTSEDGSVRDFISVWSR